MKSTHLSFDLGAGSCRAMLGTLSGNHMSMEEVYRFTTPICEQEGHLFWDIETIWDHLQTIYKTARQDCPELASLSVDSWGGDYVPIGPDGSIVRNPYCYRDPRTTGMMKEALLQVSARELFEITGSQSREFNTIYQALADHIIEPELTAQVSSRLMIADYFHYRFCGQEFTERTLASTSQMMDVRARIWSINLIKRLNLRPETWPNIVHPGTVVGNTDDGVAVVAGCSHDTACAVAAIPVETNDQPWAYISSGTWSLLGVERTEPILTDAAFQGNFTNEAGFNDTFRIIKILTGLWVLQECQRAWQLDGLHLEYELLISKARSARSLETLVDFNESQFLRTSNDMPDRIKRYCQTNRIPAPQTRGELVRLILESISRSYQNNFFKLQEIVNTRFKVLHIVGGGARNELLCRLTADACKCTVVAGPEEATALGNLLVQARTLGSLPHSTSIRDVVRESAVLTTYHPKAN